MENGKSNIHNNEIKFTAEFCGQQLLVDVQGIFVRLILMSPYLTVKKPARSQRR
jgi:hypothetical protein